MAQSEQTKPSGKHFRAMNTPLDLIQRYHIVCLRREIKADTSLRKQHDLYDNNLVGDVKANPRDFIGTHVY